MPRRVPRGDVSANACRFALPGLRFVQAMQSHVFDPVVCRADFAGDDVVDDQLHARAETAQLGAAVMSAAEAASA